jgi:integrase
MAGLVRGAGQEWSLMAAYKDDTGRWRYRRRIRLPNGKRTRIKGTPETNTRAAAEAAERDRIWRLQNPLAFADATPKEVPTLREYTDQFLNGYAADHKERSREEKRRILDTYILEELGELRLSEITQATIDTLRADLLRGRTTKTAANVLAVLSSIMKYAAQNGLISVAGFRFTVKSDEGAEVEAVPAVDIGKLIAATPDHRYRVMILLAAEAGLRAGEIRALEWADIDGELLNIRRALDTRNRPTSTKSRRHRRVPVSHELAGALDRHRQTGPTVVTKLRSPGPLTYWAMRDGILSVYDAAGVRVPSMPWHALRHSYGTALARAGVPVEVIRKAMGHASIATTLRYFHTDDDDLIAAARSTFGPTLGPSSDLA